MTKKTFFCNINKIESHNLRLINKEIIPKSFIRENLNKNIKIIDNSYSISDILLKNKKKHNKKEIGSSIKIDNNILKNKFWHMIQLNLPTLSNEKSKNLAINFSKTFSLFLRKQKVLVSILEAKKGGFVARSFGILGFLPLKQYLSVNKNLIKKPLLKKKAIAPYYFSNTYKFALKPKNALIATKKKWRFLIKAPIWFKRFKKYKKKYKKKGKKKQWKTKKIKSIKKKAKKKFKYKKCPFVFYNIHQY